MTEVQSPFLPGTKVQYAWDSTCLGYLKVCPRLYQYIIIDGWGHAEESVHLRFGQEYHSALQEYDLARAIGESHEDALHRTIRNLLVRTWIYEECPTCKGNGSIGSGLGTEPCVDCLATGLVEAGNTGRPWTPDPDTRAGKYKSRNMLVRAVIWYLDEHRDDPAKTYIKADGKPAVELSFRFELDWGPKAGEAHFKTVGNESWAELAATKIIPTQPYLLCGHLDKVVDFNDALFDMDHKTSLSTVGTYYFDQWSPNNQMTLYTIASKVVLNAPVKGVIINAAQLMLDYEKSGDYGARFVRGFTFRTPDQLSEWLADLRFWLAQAEAYAEANYWPMNDTSCDKFGGCRFREVCSKSLQVREQFLKSDFTKLPEEDRWNPLKPR